MSDNQRQPRLVLRPFLTVVLFHVFYLEQSQIFDWVIFANQKKAIPSDLLTGSVEFYFAPRRINSPVEFLSVTECFSSCFLFVCGHQGQERPVLGSHAEDICRPHSIVTVVCGYRRPRVFHWRAVLARHTRSQTEKKAAVKKDAIQTHSSSRLLVGRVHSKLGNAP